MEALGKPPVADSRLLPPSLPTGSFRYPRGTVCSALRAGASFPSRNLGCWYLILKAVLGQQFEHCFPYI